MENLNFEPTVLLKIYQLYRQIFRLSLNFHKLNRYTIGEKTLNCLLDLMELISLANIQIKTLREPILHKASAKCELLKLHLRLCYDLSLIESRQYIELETKIKEIGKMLGGWIRFLRTQ